MPNDEKDFWVLWTYEVNFSKLMKVRAISAEQARQRATWLYDLNKDFQRKASIMVFDQPPAIHIEEGVRQ